MPDVVSAVSEHFVIRNETHFIESVMLLSILAWETILVLSFVINDVRIF
jgi:hypothetical protein